MTAITYGSFNLNDGINYFVLSKPIAFPEVMPTMYKISRLEGMKKTGETINQRPIDMLIRIIGTSRSDLENKIDSMYQALNQRSQNLTMHTNDSRYFVADCVRCDAELAPGKILSTVAKVSFICYQPYAFAVSSSTFDTGTVAMTFSSGQNYTYTHTVTGGGTVFNRPQIRIYQRTVACATTLSATLNNGTVYTSLSVAALPASLTTRDTLIIGTGGTTQTVTVSANASSGATTVSVTSFTANATYTSGTAVARTAAMTNIQVTQNTDSENLFINGNLPIVAGDFLDIYCDPTNITTGFTAVLNGGVTLSNANGLFPVIEPTSTSFTYTITCLSNPSIQVVYTYTSRWL